MTALRRPVPAARQQRGVALIAAVLVVALAIVLVAALLGTGEDTRARARNSLRAEQTWQLMLGLEAWAGEALRQDHIEHSGLDSPAEPWALPIGPLQIPGGQVFGRLRQQSGCFNLNSLRDGDAESPAYRRFQRLLQVLGLDGSIAAQALDWVDDDGVPMPGGAEDALYRQRPPAGLAANQPFAHVSELRLLPAVDAEAYGRLQPHVCALPAGTPINWNFATPALWMSLHDRISDSMAARLAADGQARYRDISEIRHELQRLLGDTVGVLDAAPGDVSLDGVRTDYFVAEAEIVVDGIPHAYASLLHRDPLTGRVRVVARTRGQL